MLCCLLPPQDPNAPKKNMGAYMWFSKDKRGELKEAHPEWGVADIGRETGALWKKLSDKDKKKYEDQVLKSPFTISAVSTLASAASQ